MPEEELLSSWLAELATRLTDLEEHFRLLKERLLVVTKTLLEQKESVDKELAAIKEELKALRAETARMKEAIDSIVAESAEFVRKEELQALSRFIKLFEPMKWVTEEDVKRIIEKAMKAKL